MRVRPLWFLSACVALTLAIPAWPLWRDLVLATCGRLPNEPTLNWRSKPDLRTFMGDHFGGRDAIAAKTAQLTLNSLDVTIFPQVAIGRHGWMYFVPNEIDSARGWPVQPPARTTAIRQWFQGNRDHAKAYGAKYLLVILPCKATTYPDELPRWCLPGLRSPTDLVLADMRAHAPDLEVLDLREVVTRARLQIESDPTVPIKRVFQLYDTHWNDLGALAAATGLLEHLARSYPAIRPPRMTDFGITVQSSNAGDLARLVGLPGSLVEELPQLTLPDGSPLPHYPEDRISPGVEFGNPHGPAGLPRAVFLRDSFAQRQIPFLAPAFQSLHCVWIPGNPYGAAAVEVLRPQIVIHQMTERQFTDRAFLMQVMDTVRERQRAGNNSAK